MPKDTIEVQSVVGVASGPQVQLRWGGEEGTLTPEEALAHAMAVIEASVHARVDDFLFRFLTEKINVSTERAAIVLKEFREYCERRQPEDWRKSP